MNSIRKLFLTLAAMAFSLCALALDESTEESGHSPSSSAITPDQPAIRGQARRALLEEGVLLVPDSSNERVMAFDPNSGDLLDANFIPSDSINLATPKAIILKQDQTAFLIVDQLRNGVQQFDLDGNFVQTFAPAGGPDTSIMQNLRTVTYLPGTSNLLVTSNGGGNPNSVVEFDADGNFIGTFIDSGAGGMTSPWDLLFRDSDVLLTSSGNNAILRYDLDGNFLDQFSQGVDLNFPQQMFGVEDGNVLTTNFSPGTVSGIYELDSDGQLVGFYGAVTGNRGVYELGNGNILTTSGAGVFEIDRAGNLVDTKTTDGSFQYISFIRTGDDEAPGVGLQPAALDFGSVAVGDSASEDLTVENIGDADLIMGDLSIAGENAADYALSDDACSQAELAPGAACSITVTFTPSADGERQASVEIPSNADSSPDSAPLTGIGLTAEAGFSPDELSFGNVEIGDSGASVLTVESTGSADLTLGDLSIQGDHAADFELSDDTCSQAVLAPGANCTVSVVFSPGAQGERQASISVPSNAVTAPDSVPLAGTGTLAEAEISPLALDFGMVQVGASSDTESVTITSVGTAPVVLGTASIELGPRAVPVPDSFIVDADGCSGSTLNPGDSCTLGVFFVPDASGDFQATLAVPSNAGALSIALAGTGVQPELVIDLGVEIDFGLITLGQSSTREATLTNAGTGTAEIQQVTAPAAPFSLAGGSCLPGIDLGPGASCTLEMSFEPESVGQFSSAFDVVTNLPDSPITVDLSGAAAPEALPVPVNSPWALGLLAALMLFLALFLAPAGLTGRL